MYSLYKPRAPLAVIFSCLLVACSNQPVYTIDHNENIDFSRFSSYRWYDDVHASKTSEYRKYNSSDARVRTHIDRELQKKGLTEATTGLADLWLNYNISKQEKMRIDNFGGYPSQGMHGAVGAGTYGSAVSVGYSSGPDVKVYKEGTVVIDIIDSGSRKVIWRGIAEGKLKKSLTHKEKDHIASELSRELLASFPPEMTPQGS